MPRRVVPLVVVALCSCGAGQSERLMRDVESIIQETCRDHHAVLAERRECVAMLRRETQVGLDAANAWLEGEGALGEGAVGGTAPASPGEWLLTRAVPSLFAVIGTALLGAYVVYSWFTTPLRRRSGRPRAPYRGTGRGLPPASERADEGWATMDGGDAGGSGGGE